MRSFRRKKRQVPVSFFAFQDIITALAGSMLIIVLILAYGKSRTAAFSGKSMGSRSEYSSLQQKILLKTEELKFKRAMLAQQQLRLNNHGREAVEQRTQMLKKSTRQLREQQRDLRQELQLWSKRVARQQNILSATAPELLKGIDELDALRQQLRHRQHLLKIVKADSKQIFLLDCRRNCWRWSDNTVKNQLLGKNDPTPATALAEVTARLSSVPPQEARLILAVRPSAGNFAQALKNHLQRRFPALEIVYEPLIWEDTGGFTL